LPLGVFKNVVNLIQLATASIDIVGAVRDSAAAAAAAAASYHAACCGASELQRRPCSPVLCVELVLGAWCRTQLSASWLAVTARLAGGGGAAAAAAEAKAGAGAAAARRTSHAVGVVPRAPRDRLRAIGRVWHGPGYTNQVSRHGWLLVPHVSYYWFTSFTRVTTLPHQPGCCLCLTSVALCRVPRSFRHTCRSAFPSPSPSPS
jgi:hypothetical protein